MIQLSRLEELANHAPVPVPVQVHAEHFPEINLSLSGPERISINGIYNLIYRINGYFEKIIDVDPRCAEAAKGCCLARGESRLNFTALSSFCSAEICSAMSARRPNSERPSGLLPGKLRSRRIVEPKGEFSLALPGFGV